MTAHVLIVQDDPETSEFLDQFLGRNGYQAMTLIDPRAVCAFLEENAVDLIILDVTLPYIDGLALCGGLRRNYPDIPIIFVTARDTLRDTIAAFSHGADDYIRRPFDPDELLARIQAVMRRFPRIERHEAGALITVGDTSLDLGKLQFTAPARRPILLTPTEMKLLKCLMRNANTVTSRATLSKHIHADDMNGGNNRADVFIRRLRKKIESDPNQPTLIRTVRGIGYIFRESREEGESTG